MTVTAGPWLVYPDGEKDVQHKESMVSTRASKVIYDGLTDEPAPEGKIKRKTKTKEDTLLDRGS